MRKKMHIYVCILQQREGEICEVAAKFVEQRLAV